MDIQLILFQDHFLVTKKGKQNAAQSIKTVGDPGWEIILSDYLCMPLEKEDFFIKFDPKGQSNNVCIVYVELGHSVVLTDDFEKLDLRNKVDLVKENQSLVRKYIEFGVLSNALPQWLDEIKLLYFSGDTPFYTPRQLEALEERAQVTQLESQMTNKALLLSMALPFLLGLVMDQFFNGHRFGVSVMLFFCLVSGVVLWKRENLQINSLSIAYGLGAFGLALSFAIFNNEVLRVLNALLLPFAVTGFYVTLLSKNWNVMDVRFFSTVMGKVIGEPVAALTKLAVPVKRVFQTKQPKVDARVIQIGLGVVLAVPILLIILMFLSGSDQIFSKAVSDLFDFSWLDSLDQWMEHGIVVGLCSFYFFGYLWHMTHGSDGHKPLQPTKRYLETPTMITILSLVLLVYTAFAYVQVRYLFLQGALPNGFSFAEYARRGFFELVAVTCFNALILVLSHTGTKYNAPNIERIVKGLLTALVGFSFMLLYTGFYRMFLYESVYGYTELRLFVLFFMAFMGISLGLVLAWIWREQVPLLKGVVILSIAFYMALNYINVDATIAYRNIHHPKAAEMLDEEHLGRLSVDAYGVLKKELVQHPRYKEILNNFKTNHVGQLEEELPWFSYNYLMSRYLVDRQ